nr:unnamed protein product [Callosobruchus analis]
MANRLAVQQQLFSEVFQFYGLSNSIQGVMTDNSNSNFTFINELKRNIPDIDPKNNHFVCFALAHILNLRARDFMKILDSELEELDNMPSKNPQTDDDEINEEVQPQSPVKKNTQKN